MYAISNIIADINRGCLANNMTENRFSYRIVFFVNENGKGTKHYINTSYDGLRKSLESIIREYLSVTNNIVVAETTALKNGKCICLQSRAYSFSLDEYFRRLNGEYKDKRQNESMMYCRYAVQ